MMESDIIQLKNVSKLYGDNVRALDNINFSCKAGAWVSIMGPSGSGKTTLLNILGGLDTPTAGDLIVNGENIARATEKDLDYYRREVVGFVFQEPFLVPYLTAVENVMLAQYFHSMTDEAEARGALDRVGLGHRLTHLPSQLSGGEKQRICIARAIINDPRILLADEPTGSLDHANEQIILDIFQKLHAGGLTIIMVTHNVEVGALGDPRVNLEHGRIVSSGLARCIDIPGARESGQKEVPLTR